MIPAFQSSHFWKRASYHFEYRTGTPNAKNYGEQHFLEFLNTEPYSSQIYCNTYLYQVPAQLKSNRTTINPYMVISKNGQTQNWDLKIRHCFRSKLIGFDELKIDMGSIHTCHLSQKGLRRLSKKVYQSIDTFIWNSLESVSYHLLNNRARS